MKLVELNELNYPTSALCPFVSGVSTFQIQDQTAEMEVKVFDWAFFQSLIIKAISQTVFLSRKKMHCGVLSSHLNCIFSGGGNDM